MKTPSMKPRNATLWLMLLACFWSFTASRPSSCRCDSTTSMVNCSALHLSTLTLRELPCGQSFRRIDLSQNAFSQLPGDVHRFRFVDLTHNWLRTLDSDVDQNVEVLDVSHNSISEINLKDNFWVLRNLHVVNNKLGESSVDYLKGRCKLEHIDLSGNNINSLDSAMNCKYLFSLIATQNRISEIPREVLKLKFLQMLYLSHNQIEHLRNLPDQLVILDLSFNSLSEIGVSSFTNLVSLKLLDISNNMLSDIHPETFVSLENLDKLNIARNEFVSLRENVFRGLHSLKILDLSANRIHSLSSTEFAELVNLESLDLSENVMTTLPGLVLGSRVQEVSLFFNHIRHVNSTALLSLLGGGGERFVNAAGNPFRGSDPGWAALARRGFAWQCDHGMAAQVDAFVDGDRPSDRFRFHTLAVAPDAEGRACPCALLSKEAWSLVACVRDDAQVARRHWMDHAMMAAGGGERGDEDVVHEEM